MRRSLPVPIERSHVHPAVANWLEVQGYQWDYEVRLSTKSMKRVDFYATHPESVEPFLIECKYGISGVKAFFSTFEQIQLYAELLGNPRVNKVLAIFKCDYSFALNYACKNQDITLLVLDCEVIRGNGETFIRLSSGEIELPYWHRFERDTMHKKTVRCFKTTNSHNCAIGPFLQKTIVIQQKE